ncbi:MAG: hypothetical protein R3F11_19430 [Verrucomicrobiales bacterium]
MQGQVARSSSRHRSSTACDRSLNVQSGRHGIGRAPFGDGLFAAPLQKSDVFEVAENGIELGTKDGVLDYAFLTIENFKGHFHWNGEPVAVGRDSREATIKKSFGEPYWIDRSDGETIMFYEYAEGTIELQFEFPDSGSLGFVTLSRGGSFDGGAAEALWRRQAMCTTKITKPIKHLRTSSE